MIVHYFAIQENEIGVRLNTYLFSNEKIDFICVGDSVWFKGTKFQVAEINPKVGNTKAMCFEVKQNKI